MTVPSWPSPCRVPVAAASLARHVSPSAPPLRLDARHEFRRLLAQPFVRHAPASRHVVVREPPAPLAHFSRKTLLPVGAPVRPGLTVLHVWPSPAPQLRARPRLAPA